MRNIPFTQLEEFFKNHIPPEEAIELNPGEIIRNPKKFIETHLETLRANSGNRRMMPFYNRLLKYYLIVNKK